MFIEDLGMGIRGWGEILVVLFWRGSKKILGWLIFVILWWCLLVFSIRVYRLEKECDENYDLESLYECMLLNSVRLIVNEIIWKIRDV